MTENRPKTYGLPKAARLTGKKKIEELFQDGSSLFLFPLMLRYRLAEGATEHRVLISVPKKKLKRAVDRNKVKRRIREAYRLQREIMEGLPHVHIGIIYQDKTIQAYREIVDKLSNLLHRLQKEIKKSHAKEV
jgi:ribonuclease P protein component